MSRRLVSSGSQFEDDISYSRAVVDGDYVFVSGTTGYHYDNMSISADAVEQAEQCFRNIQHALQMAGSDMDQVVRIRYIFTDKADFEPCWPVFRRYLSTARPAATLLIAGLMDDKMKMEIEVTARSSGA